MDSGDWAGSATVGVLQPVLLVRPGNPQKIQSLADLTRPNLKIGIGDPRYSTCGELFVRLLEEKGLHDQVMKQVVLQGRTHAKIANGLILGPLDAVVVWNFVAQLYRDKVELVPTTDRYAEIKVTVVGLKRSRNPAQRDAFLDLCRAQQVKAIFAENGYVANP
jgi:molybdate transport system substrate-binding protein